MTRRTGATLIEVLVTLFVMSLGLITLLTLFPLGALRMSEAIKDSRTANAAGNAAALATARAFRSDSSLINRYKQPPNNAPAAPDDGPSYPVYMDPIGRRSYSGGAVPALQEWVGATGPIGIHRVQPSFIAAGNATIPVQIQRTLGAFSLLDDITFGPNGIPIGPDGLPSGGNNLVQREGRYTWGLLFKRPKTATPSVVDMTVVVYSGRPQQLNSGLQTGFGESRYDADDGGVVVGGNTLTVRWLANAEKPNIKKGSWILDATAERPYNAALPPADPLNRDVLRYGPVHGFFYRVAKVVSEDNISMVLQLTTQLKAPINGGDGRQARIIVMEYVSEVFEKGPGWLP